MELVHKDASIIDSQTVPAADTVPRSSRGWDGGQSGRKASFADSDRTERHTIRNECTEANLEPVSDTPTTCPVRFPLQPSCCLTACTDPYIRLASAYLRDATDRPLPVSHAARDPQVKDTVLLRDCAERTTRRNLVVTVTKLRHHATAYGRAPRRIRQRSNVAAGKMDIDVRQTGVDIT